MKLVEALTILALFTGPVASVLIAQSIQRRESLRNQRLNLFMSLLATRTDRLGAEHLRTLSLLDVAFTKYPRVRQKWADYYESLNNPAFSNENGVLTRSMKFNDMLAEMARAVGYGKHIGFEEISRSYIPVGVADERTSQKLAQSELIRVLKNSDTFGKRDRCPNSRT